MRLVGFCDLNALERCICCRSVQTVQENGLWSLGSSSLELLCCGVFVQCRSAECFRLGLDPHRPLTGWRATDGDPWWKRVCTAFQFVALKQSGVFFVVVFFFFFSHLHRSDAFGRHFYPSEDTIQSERRAEQPRVKSPWLKSLWQPRDLNL